MEGIAFSPQRFDPTAYVQYADYTNIQFLQIKDSEDEEDAKGRW